MPPMTEDRMKRRQAKDTKDAWLVTYSDMVTLLLAFFVLLFSFSTLDMVRFQRALISLQEALGVLQGGRTVAADPVDTDDTLNREMHREALQIAQLLAVRQQLERALEDGDLGGGVTLDLTERGLILHFTDRVLFESGSADLRPGAREVLDRISPILAEIPNHIRIEGHTDNVPINTFRFPSNWELSTARATSVLQYLLQLEASNPGRLSAAGYGEYRPLDTNDTVEGRARNRRVDVVLLRLDAGRYEPPGAPGSEGGGT